MNGACLKLALLLPCLLAAVAAEPAATQSGAGDDGARERSAQVDALFERWHRPDSPGGSVLVMRNGEVVHARGYGMANLEHGIPNRTTTVFDIASVSKQFAAFAIAMLAEEGSLSLDDDVRVHIPELPDFGDTIRIRHLVHHTSGLRDWPGTLRLAGWDYMDVVSYEQILAMAFHQRELNFVPGSDYAYSNTGYNLLAEIVARVTGGSFREWTRERLFEPLGMRHTHFHDDWTEVVPGRAESYRPAGDGSFRRVVSNLTAIGSSSLFTTIEDLARWIRNFEDPVVGGSQVARQMHERGVLSNGEPVGYAFGLAVEEYRGAITVSHGGSWGGYRSMLLRLPDHGLAVVILGNASDLNPGELAYRIADLYLADDLGPASEPEPAAPRRGGSSTEAAPWAPSATDLAAYAGEYRSSELFTSYELIVEDGELVARHFRTGTTALRPVAADVFQAPWFGRIEFVRGADGQVSAFTATSVRVRGLRFDRVR
jgi:CubicO group peptidase (beta-lactamase class C family)